MRNNQANPTFKATSRRRDFHRGLHKGQHKEVNLIPGRARPSHNERRRQRRRSIVSDHEYVLRESDVDIYVAAGDRSHIPPQSQPIFEILYAEMQRIKARAPVSFKPQVLDTEKRLNILFDHLNNEEVLKPDTIDEMAELSDAIRSHQYDHAQALFTDIMTTKTDEGSNWMVSSLASFGETDLTCSIGWR